MEIKPQPPQLQSFGLFKICVSYFLKIHYISDEIT